MKIEIWTDIVCQAVLGRDASDVPSALESGHYRNGSSRCQGCTSYLDGSVEGRCDATSVTSYPLATGPSPKGAIYPGLERKPQETDHHKVEG